MNSWPNCIILISTVCAFWPLTTKGQEELPFWRTKPKLMTRMTDNRKVVVSVDLEEKGHEKKIRIMGAGVVNVPLYYAKEQLLQFEQLPKASTYFQKVKHDPEKKQVYFFMKAFGTQVRFIQQYQWGRVSPGEVQMDWRVTWGQLKGMVGNYKLRKISATKTEMSIWASFKKGNLPIPQFLINFTLEVIAEKTAQKMRAFIEQQYHQSQTPRVDDVKK